MTTELYATIKKSSKYYYQAKLAKDKQGAYPFPVTIQNDTGGYIVAGGPGGQYRLTDVHLHARVNGEMQKLT